MLKLALLVILPFICVEALIFTVPDVLFSVAEMKSAVLDGLPVAEVVSEPVFVNVAVPSDAVEVLLPMMFRFPELVTLFGPLNAPLIVSVPAV